MVAMVEINIDEKVHVLNWITPLSLRRSLNESFCHQIPVPLLITFAVCTVLLIAVHMLALMISTCILPNVEAVANLHYQASEVEDSQDSL